MLQIAFLLVVSGWSGLASAHALPAGASGVAPGHRATVASRKTASADVPSRRRRTPGTTTLSYSLGALSSGCTQNETWRIGNCRSFDWSTTRDLGGGELQITYLSDESSYRDRNDATAIIVNGVTLTTLINTGCNPTPCTETLAWPLGIGTATLQIVSTSSNGMYDRHLMIQAMVHIPITDTIEVYGAPSTTDDGAPSQASCPSSHPNAVACRCDGECDGSFIGNYVAHGSPVNGNAAIIIGSSCSAVASGGTIGAATAVATCSRLEHSVLGTVGSEANNVSCDSRQEQSRFCDGTTTATCPSGTTVLSCSCLSHQRSCGWATLEQTLTSCSYTARDRARSYARCGTLATAAPTVAPTVVPTRSPTRSPTFRTDESSSESSSSGTPTAIIVVLLLIALGAIALTVAKRRKRQNSAASSKADAIIQDRQNRTGGTAIQDQKNHTGVATTPPPPPPSLPAPRQTTDWGDGGPAPAAAVQQACDHMDEKTQALASIAAAYEYNAELVGLTGGPVYAECDDAVSPTYEPPAYEPHADEALTQAATNVTDNAHELHELYEVPMDNLIAGNGPKQVYQNTADENAPPLAVRSAWRRRSQV